MKRCCFHCLTLHKLALCMGAGAFALLLALPLPVLGQGAGSLYSTKFEAPPFVAGLPLAGQDGWNAPPPLSPLAAVVSTAQPRQGKQSVQVWGGDLEHQDFINELTDGYYDAIGSYRKPIGYDTGGIVPVRLSAHIRIDGPLTAGDNFFSAALSARAVMVNSDGETDTIGVGQIDISSDGHAYGHDGNSNVPVFLASTPIALGEWHEVTIVLDFAAQTFTLSIDEESLGTYPFPEPDEGFITTDTLARGSLIAFTAPDTDSTSKTEFLASYDKFSVDLVGGGRAK